MFDSRSSVILVLSLLLACGSGQQVKKIMEFKLEFKLYQNLYDSNLNVPDFFRQVCSNHKTGFFKKDSSAFLEFCIINNHNPNDSVIKNTYFSLYILHSLFTSSSAFNGSKGEILNIPYLWHWVKPNPRHEIMLTENSSNLKKVKPPEKYNKYNSFADIDRTPALFFADMFETRPKYYLDYTDTFATFGWCSEREMAFSGLTCILGYKSRVFVSGNHCWTELLVSLKNKNNITVNYIIKVDNTFNLFDWTKSQNISEKEFLRTGKLKGMELWYNTRSHESRELNTIKNINVPFQVSTDIEKRILNFLYS